VSKKRKSDLPIIKLQFIKSKSGRFKFLVAESYQDMHVIIDVGKKRKGKVVLHGPHGDCAGHGLKMELREKRKDEVSKSELRHMPTETRLVM
jgi:hypothetical protein